MRSERPSAMNRRSLLIFGATSMALSACSVGKLFGPPDAPQLYVLKPAMPAPESSAKITWALAIDLPEATQNLDSDRIAISRSPNTQDYYGNAAWPDQLPEIIQGLVVSAFESNGRIEQVVRDTDGIRTDYLLKIDIRDFEARYDQPEGAPTAAIAFQVILVDRKDRSFAAHLSIKKESAATQNTVDAAIEAMDRALSAALADIVTWTLATLPPAPLPGAQLKHRKG